MRAVFDHSWGLLAKEEQQVLSRLSVFRGGFTLEAAHLAYEGIASFVDVDRVMRDVGGFRMGPFELMDFVGLDTTCYIADIMFDEFKEKRFAPPSLLKRMVMAGFMGKKSGKGFYDWTNPDQPVAQDELLKA